MRKISLLFGILFASICLAVGAVDSSVVDELESQSVTIKTSRGGFGSGVLITRPHPNGKESVTFVLTAGHVVAPRNSGSFFGLKLLPEFADVEIIQITYDDSRIVGHIEFKAEVLRYSDAETGEDLALLRVRKRNFTSARAIFWRDSKPPRIGTPICHVGSMGGLMGEGSFTTGVISRLGRIFQNVEYDQISATALPGSSGGGVFSEDGKLIGIYVRQASPTVGFMVPVRRIIRWAEKENIQFIFNDAEPVPSSFL